MSVSGTLTFQQKYILSISVIILKKKKRSSACDKFDRVTLPDVEDTNSKTVITDSFQTGLKRPLFIYGRSFQRKFY